MDKPLELMKRPILNHTERGQWVYDPFLGSGTTLLAAEATERRCAGLEIDPGYVDVAVERWQRTSRREATLEATGESFAQVQAQRLPAAPCPAAGPARGE